MFSISFMNSSTEFPRKKIPHVKHMNLTGTSHDLINALIKEIKVYSTPSTNTNFGLRFSADMSWRLDICQKNIARLKSLEEQYGTAEAPRAEILACLMYSGPAFKAMVQDCLAQFPRAGINKDFAEKIVHLQNEQLTRLLQTPQINLLYRFFNVGVRCLPKVEVTIKNEHGEEETIVKESNLLPDEVFRLINKQQGDENPYYRKAKALIEKEPWPITTEEFEGYETRLIAIVNTFINKAQRFKATHEEETTYKAIQLG